MEKSQNIRTKSAFMPTTFCKNARTGRFFCSGRYSHKVGNLVGIVIDGL